MTIIWRCTLRGSRKKLTQGRMKSRAKRLAGDNIVARTESFPAGIYPGKLLAEELLGQNRPLDP
jgi:hypothetical protein